MFETSADDTSNVARLVHLRHGSLSGWSGLRAKHKPTGIHFTIAALDVGDRGEVLVIGPGGLAHAAEDCYLVRQPARR